MSEAAPPKPTPAAIAAAIGVLDAPALRELAGHLVAELARQRSTVVDGEEIRRRVGQLTAGARDSKFGRLLCPFCGSLHLGDRGMGLHLRRTHRQEIADLPAGQFERRGA